jgi:5-methylcytosine-specific restriction endonuclease McrA
MTDTLEFLDPKTLSAIIAAIRKSFIKSIEYTVVKHKSLNDSKGPRGGRVFICAHCNDLFGEGKVKVDHIIPIVPVDSTISEMTLRMYYERCFCSVDNLQVLCHDCHDQKSRVENEERKQFKKLRKKLVEPKKKLRVA